MNRRNFLISSGGLAGAALLAHGPSANAQVGSASSEKADQARFKLGTITYNIGASWDLATLLNVCKATGFEYVELRTTHAHKVEPGLTPDERREVKKRFEDAGISLWSFGTVCEFQSPDSSVVKKQVETCQAFCELAAQVGAKGVKVRPNGLPPGVETQKTLEQIGHALQECGKAADAHGVEIWVEVHGNGTQLPSSMRTILDHCGHSRVGICWNSNPTDVKNGSVKEAFDLLKKDIRSCHINELWSAYPYRELFSELKAIGYDRVTFMEVAGVPELPDSKEPDAAIRFMHYYKALWSELAG
jgi:sugar phosphate isomerase/epimerase